MVTGPLAQPVAGPGRGPHFACAFEDAGGRREKLPTKKDFEDMVKSLLQEAIAQAGFEPIATL
jgi:hypothetical protein